MDVQTYRRASEGSGGDSVASLENRGWRRAGSPGPDGTVPMVRDRCRHARGAVNPTRRQNQLATLRLAAGVSREELAEAVGLSPSWLRSAESGRCRLSAVMDARLRCALAAILAARDPDPEPEHAPDPDDIPMGRWIEP